MPVRPPDNDEERLPWLEPQNQAMPPKPPAPRRSNGGLIAFAGGLAVLAAAGGGYWVGQRDPDRAAAPSEVAIAPVAQAPVVQPAPIVAPPIAEVVPPVEAGASLNVEQVAVPEPAEWERRLVRQREARRAAIESARRKQVRAAQVRAAERKRVAQKRAAQKRAAQVRAAQNRAAQNRARAARRPSRAWPRMPSPGPAGQVIQLGAFRNPSGATRAYQTRLARYPMLRAMPRVVVPVATKPRGQILYVLRLGTSSRQQSRIVCRNLRASGDHCLVIG